MYSIIRIPDALRVEYGEGSASGADIRFTVGNTVKVYCRASRVLRESGAPPME